MWETPAADARGGKREAYDGCFHTEKLVFIRAVHTSRELLRTEVLCEC